MKQATTKMNNFFNQGKLMQRLILLMFICLASVNFLMAQGSEGDFFRNIGKIYVVVAVVVATFLGIIFYLIYLSRKIKKLEDEINA